MALLGSNEPVAAAEAFRGALKVAAKAGIHQTILDQGVEIGSLLLQVQEHGERSGQPQEVVSYAATLVASWRELCMATPLRSGFAVAD